MEMVYVVPAAGGRIRQPERAYRPMPAEGDFVPRNSFWEKLIVTGDVIVTDPPKAEAPAEVTADEAQSVPAKSSTRTRNPSKDEA